MWRRGCDVMLLFIDDLTSWIFCMCIFWGHGGYQKRGLSWRKKSPLIIFITKCFTHTTQIQKPTEITLYTKLNCKVHMCWYTPFEYNKMPLEQVWNTHIHALKSCNQNYADLIFCACVCVFFFSLYMRYKREKKRENDDVSKI